MHLTISVKRVFHTSPSRPGLYSSYAVLEDLAGVEAYRRNEEAQSGKPVVFMHAVDDGDLGIHLIHPDPMPSGTIEVKLVVCYNNTDAMMKSRGLLYMKEETGYCAVM